MEARWFNVAVVLIWLSTMSWLVVAKVLPPLDRGEPPTYAVIVPADPRPVYARWRLYWNNKEIGWAETRMARTPLGIGDIRSRVHFVDPPLADLLPPLLRGHLTTALGLVKPLVIDSTSRLSIDARGRLTAFRSTVRISGREVVTLEGEPDGSQIKVVAEIGGTLPLTTTVRIPADALVGDELSPQTRLPDLKLGQQWTVPVFNPLQASAKMEILQATVDRDEVIVWNGQPVMARVVEYRGDPGSALGATTRPRARLWVSPDGNVLKQEIHAFQTTICFERIPSRYQREQRQLREQVEQADPPLRADGSP